MTADPEVLRARYPDPPPPPDAWLGWKRVRGGPWQSVPGTVSPTKGQCYRLLTERTELVGGEQKWELSIQPFGAGPPLDAGPGRRR